MREKIKKNVTFLNLIIVFVVLLSFAAFVSAENKTISITVNFSNVTDELQTITVDYCDDWLLQPDDVYNHKLMQASFAMAVSGFRSKVYELGELDHDILDFFRKAGFSEPQSDDFNKPTGIDTIGTLIAHKKVGEAALIGVSISGNNYQNEWLSNLTIENEVRPKGFNNAAQTVLQRVEGYIKAHQLSGDLRLWVSGYSRAAAVTNIFAADASDSHIFSGVYAYTFATPRTTRDVNSKRFRNIFNMINPEDVVPMIPFPEWGYERYGTDLYLPSISTTSSYNDLYIKATEAADFDTGDLPFFNPRMRRELHTDLDYFAYFVNSADAYTRGVQSILLRFWQDRDLNALFTSLIRNINFSDLLKSIVHRDSAFRNRLYEIYNFIDFNVRVIFQSYLSNEFGSDDDYWDNSVSLQENIAFGHYDKSYRFWLFASDDPDELFTKYPEYLRLLIVGDVDVEVLDEKGDMIQQLDHEGWFFIDTSKPFNPDFHGQMSNILLYMERIGNQTLIELPCDQEKYTIYVKSNQEQIIHVSMLQYSAERLKADILFSYDDHYDKDEGYAEEFHPATDLVTNDYLEEEFDLRTFELWPEYTDYSPSAVMLRENNGAFLPKSLAVFVLLHIFFNQLLALVVILLVITIRKTVFFIQKKVFGKEIPENTDRLEPPEAKKSHKVCIDTETQPASASENAAMREEIEQ